MDVSHQKLTGPPSILDHDLQQYFPELLKFESTREMEASEVWRKIRPEVVRILDAVVVSEQPAPVGRDLDDTERKENHPVGETPPPLLRKEWSQERISALAWNIERGIQLDGIVEALKNHDRLKNKDLLLLTELDYGMARSGNRFVAKEITDALGLNYAFAPVYIALQKGSGVESAMEGENTAAIHGLAMFSLYPMTNIHA
ncbi:MAG: hypothetical protein ABJB40_11805, partial [Acidobacteriota bacterium]